MLRLSTLGSLGLTRADGVPIAGLLQQPKRMAVLVYLAVDQRHGSMLREAVRNVFWGDHPELRGRRALNQALYVLRSSLGAGVIESRGAVELQVNGAALHCDAAAFDAAIEGRRPLDALALYRGDFLPGLTLSDAAEFERWVESTRSRLRFRAADAAAALFTSACADGNLREAIRWGRKRLELLPTDELALRELLVVFAEAGDRAAAADAYRAFARDLASDLEMAPSPETQELLQRIRGPGIARPSRPAFQPTAPAPVIRFRRRRWPLVALAASLLAAIGVTGIIHDHSGSRTRSSRDRISAESLTRMGRFFWSRRDRESLRSATQLFRRAVAADAGYAPAYSGLADTYTLRAWYGDSVDSYSAATAAQARTFALTAVQLNDQLADAHTSLGAIQAWFDRDWRRAEAEYRRAISLDSCAATAHQWLALGLATHGRIDEAVREMRTALQCDSSSPSIATDLATVLFWAGHDREALSQVRLALALDPTSPRASAQLWRIYMATGQDRLAMVALEQVIAARGGSSADIGRLNGVYAKRGFRSALDWWAQSLEHSSYTPDRAIRIAVIYGMLNRNEQALRWLLKAREEGSQFLQFAAVDPAFVALRGDPLFRSIVTSQ
ncbi:MAG TPA: BTAD domain-containing putative transcriptional regulator [Gemmatimonadales bacterium]|nr:BTAD domain-containing putative transcriptional regulator [Gemmatimonadales bacterium]